MKMAVLLSQLEHLLLLQHPFLLISLLSITAATLMLLVSLLVRGDKLSTEIPPSPRKFPLLGNLHQLGRLPHRSLRDLANKHGPLMLLHLGSIPTLVVSSAELARDIMKTHDLACASRPPSSMADKLLYGSRDVALSPYGEYWRQARRVCVLHLLSLNRVQMFSPVREQEIAHMLRKIRASSTNGASLNLSEIIIAMTNNISCRVAFGRTFSEKKGSDQIKRVLGDFVALLGEFPVGDYIPWLAWVDSLSGLTKRADKNFKELDAFLEEVIQDYYRSKRSGDDPTKEKQQSFVDVLLALDETEGIGVTLSRENIKALLLDMFGGGTDTTFAAIEWTMAELVGHPETMKRVQKEVRGVVGIKADITNEDLERMKYLKAVIKESLRLHPPAPLLVPRQSTKQIKLQGYNIPAMTRIVINAWAIGTDPNVWQRPDEFWPDRFLDNAIGYKGRDFELIPFGSGRRGCPGISIAIPTIEHAVANLLYHFDWEMPGAMSSEKLDVSELSGLAVHLKSSLVLVAKPL